MNPTVFSNASLDENVAQKMWRGGGGGGGPTWKS